MNRLVLYLTHSENISGKEKENEFRLRNALDHTYQGNIRLFARLIDVPQNLSPYYRDMRGFIVGRIKEATESCGENADPQWDVTVRIHQRNYNGNSIYFSLDRVENTYQDVVESLRYRCQTIKRAKGEPFLWLLQTANDPCQPTPSLLMWLAADYHRRLVDEVRNQLNPALSVLSSSLIEKNVFSKTQNKILRILAQLRFCEGLPHELWQPAQEVENLLREAKTAEDIRKSKVQEKWDLMMKNRPDDEQSVWRPLIT